MRPITKDHVILPRSSVASSAPADFYPHRVCTIKEKPMQQPGSKAYLIDLLSQHSLICGGLRRRAEQIESSGRVTNDGPGYSGLASVSGRNRKWRLLLFFALRHNAVGLNNLFYPRNLPRSAVRGRYIVVLTLLRKSGDKVESLSPAAGCRELQELRAPEQGNVVVVHVFPVAPDDYIRLWNFRSFC